MQLRVYFRAVQRTIENILSLRELRRVNPPADCVVSHEAKASLLFLANVNCAGLINS